MPLVFVALYHKKFSELSCLGIFFRMATFIFIAGISISWLLQNEIIFTQWQEIFIHAIIDIVFYNNLPSNDHSFIVFFSLSMHLLVAWMGHVDDWWFCITYLKFFFLKKLQNMTMITILLLRNMLYSVSQFNEEVQMQIESSDGVPGWPHDNFSSFVESSISVRDTNSW